MHSTNQPFAAVHKWPSCCDSRCRCSSFPAVPTHINSKPMHAWLGVDTVIVFIALDWNCIEFNVVHRSFVGGKLGLLAALYISHSPRVSLLYSLSLTTFSSPLQSRSIRPHPPFFIIPSHSPTLWLLMSPCFSVPHSAIHFVFYSPLPVPSPPWLFYPILHP